ncbi:beta-ketoacyl-ACP synthase II [Ichthyobacterium seriolicida]|uniref:3-oxoacyl-[acyl-carrier-protein] synthase 2 n=1 Tax=Ichthyobacterium seriolicida TaxID=242600 RepID=A0A1J1E9C3_9FLAO|nr:beta-ketoacyl-ACP synthase II [Ichthyobacterium seriolicida]BAV94128.1 3-oxoacyl-[acyl-carrier-protein] synthase, KASII [Ichthyobacterium seriolicida]
MQLKRVVVTGMGSLTPIGNTVDEYWESLLKGVSGAAPITYFDASNYKTKFACELKNFSVSDHISRRDINKMDLNTQYAMVSAHEAFLDSGIDSCKEVNKDRVGVIWGSGIGGLKTVEEVLLDFYEGGGEMPRFSPFFIPKMIADITAGHISVRYGFRGPNYATVSACSSSAHALIDSFNTIRLGKADIIFAGGSEATITRSGIGGFNSINALSVRNDDPSTASRPFDKDRDGFVMGEGSGTMVLEEYEHAKNRGAKIYAEFIGGAMSADAHHITAPHPEGLGAKNVMIECIKDSGLSKEDIDMVNMHGTSTPLGDMAEVKAVKDVFGDHVYNININSTKSMTGHLLGATGVVEAISCVLSIRGSFVPPTINHFTDDDCIDSRLNFTFNKSQKRDVNVAMSNTFGFGGHNACVMLKKI